MKTRKHIHASELPLGGWTRVDIAGIWATELFPLLDASKARRVFEVVLVDHEERSGDEIIAFAKGLASSEIVRELAECARRNDEVHRRFAG